MRHSLPTGAKRFRYLFFCPTGDPLPRKDFIAAALFIMSVNWILCLALRALLTFLGDHATAFWGVGADSNVLDLFILLGLITLVMLFMLPYYIITYRRLRYIGLTVVPSFFLCTVPIGISATWLDDPFSFSAYLLYALFLAALIPWEPPDPSPEDPAEKPEA